MRTQLLFIICALCVTSAAGQTEAELERAYGKPTLAYSVTEHIWMTPDFAADGQVCQMRFYPKRVDHGVAYTNGSLRFEELKWILNHVVPPAARGKRLTSGFSANFGASAATDYTYEKVNVTFAFSIDIRFNPKALKDAEEYVLLDGPDTGDGMAELPMPPPPPPSSEADFDDVRNAEIAVVSWKARKCVEETDAKPVETPKVTELEQQFGQPDKIYNVGSLSSMTPAFGLDGQVCQMWVYPRRISEKTSIVGNMLQFDEVRSFLNRLVQPEQRGLKQEENFGTTATGGHLAWTTYPYERMSFTFTSAARTPQSSDGEPILKRGEFTFPYSPPVARDHIPSVNDFQPTDNVQIVHVRWEQRTCAGF